MRILFIVPTGYQSIRESIPPMPSLGVSYLAATLLERGHAVNIIDNFFENLKHPQLLKRMRASSPDIIGLSFGTDNRFAAIRLIKDITRIFPDIPIIIGGPHPTLATEDFLTHVPGISCAVLGEAEQTLPDLLRHYTDDIPFEDIPGIAWTHDNKVLFSAPRNTVRNLDILPFPARHLLNDWNRKTWTYINDKKYSVGHLMTSRGCPFHCNFCSESQFWSHKIRFRSPENVLAEIRQLVNDYIIQSLWFYDSVINASTSHIMKLCDLLLSNDIRLPWRCNIRVDNMSKEMLSKMSASGCYCVSMGVESGSERVLNQIVDKKITIEQVHNVLAWCRELNVMPHGFFILSHPTETYDEAKKSISLMRKFQTGLNTCASIGLGVLRIYPGTTLEAHARETGYLPKNFTWTRRLRSVPTLPVQGDSPVYIDKISFTKLSELIFQWQALTKDPFYKRIPSILKDLFTLQGILKYTQFLLGYLKHRFFIKSA